MTLLEVGRMGVQPDLDIKNPVTTEGKIVADAWKSVATLPGGPQRVFWGLNLDNSQEFWAFFEWNAMEEHQKFAEEHGIHVVKDFPKVFTPGFTKHVQSNDIKNLSTPVTEIVMIHFPSNISTVDKDSAVAALHEIVYANFDECDDTGDVEFGWGVETDFPATVDGTEFPTAVLNAFIGWPSIEIARKWHETEGFKKGMELIAWLKDVVKVKRFCVEFQTVARDSSL